MGTPSSLMSKSPVTAADSRYFCRRVHHEAGSCFVSHRTSIPDVLPELLAFPLCDYTVKQPIYVAYTVVGFTMTMAEACVCTLLLLVVVAHGPLVAHTSIGFLLV